MTVSEEKLAHWRQWIGKTETRSERLDPESLRRYAAALGENLDVEQRLPSLGHWAFFLPVAANVGADGHPERGEFLPPITLTRRMFAAATLNFTEPLVIGADADRISTVIDLTRKSGRSGELVLVEVEHEISQGGRTRLVERHTLVYRNAEGCVPPVELVDLPVVAGDERWQPTAVDLFRFSAATFNSHRIHYDLPYATREEGYPALVVQGPFTAARLFRHAARCVPAPRQFSFRALAPLFCEQPVILATGDELGIVRALRCDGAQAMSARASP